MLWPQLNVWECDSIMRSHDFIMRENKIICVDYSTENCFRRPSGVSGVRCLNITGPDLLHLDLGTSFKYLINKSSSLAMINKKLNSICPDQSCHRYYWQQIKWGALNTAELTECMFNKMGLSWGTWLSILFTVMKSLVFQLRSTSRNRDVAVQKNSSHSRTEKLVLQYLWLDSRK